MKHTRLVLRALAAMGMAIGLLALVPSSAGATTYSSLTLINGWTTTPFGTGRPSVATISGIVTLSGAMATSGSNATAFVLPIGSRPATDVYVPVNLCNATKGRLYIQPTGDVSVQAEGGNFANAQCFTSLDGASFAVSSAGFGALVLTGGWTNAPFGTSNAQVRSIAGVVHLKGAIATAGTDPVPFTLPVGFRPPSNAYVPVDLCNAAKGRLFIQPSGVVTVQAETAFTDAQCFTSLDGVSFATNAIGFSALTPVNGWTNAPFGTGVATTVDLAGVAHLKGAIATAGTNPVAFTLPFRFRPAANVYVSVDLCNATKGRLLIQPSGVVSVEAEGGTFSNAQCFTSLDGASFTVTAFSALSLVNGWVGGSFGTSQPAVANVAGIVTLAGAMSTSGTNPVAFTLPAGSRPTTTVYVPVNLCNSAKGRLIIQPSGVVTVVAKTAFSDAQCFTSLDGVSFAANAAGFSLLPLVNGWTNAPFATSNAAVRNIAGIVHLKGAIASGTTGVAFTLPVVDRPATDVYVPVDLCNAAKGRLYIQPSGVVTVQAETAFTDAQCFTSLDGVSYATSATGFNALTLVNGWTNAPFATSAASVETVSGIAHLKGAIGSGTSAVAFTLPARFRPPTDVYVPVDLCNATNGRLLIQANGTVTVQAEGGVFTNAQCFTSLDSATFAL